MDLTPTVTRRELTRQDEHQQTQQRRIPKIHNPARQRRKANIFDPVQQTAGKNIKRTRARREEATPLPVIILRTQKEVNHEHRHRRGGDNHQPKANKQEAEHIVDLAEPDAVHDEIQLDEDGAKRQHARERHAG